VTCAGSVPVLGKTGLAAGRCVIVTTVLMSEAPEPYFLAANRFGADPGLGA
jgi:hypothetical protein